MLLLLLLLLFMKLRPLHVLFINSSCRLLLHLVLDAQAAVTNNARMHGTLGANV